MKDDAEDRRIGSNIRFQREEKKLSQGELARLMREAGQEHWHQTTVSRVERGAQSVTAGELLALERLLGAGTVLGSMTDESLQALGVSLERALTVRHLRKVHSALDEAQALVQYLREMYQDPELEDDGVDSKEA